jgi:hypothetical protein
MSLKELLGYAHIETTIMCLQVADVGSSAILTISSADFVLPKSLMFQETN